MRKYLGKTDKLSYICHGKADKIRPFNNRKGDKDMIKRKIDRCLADHRSFVKSLCEYLGLFLVSVE